MSISLTIRNWLIYAFEEPIDRINESYYFDKRDNQFFSIFITDYLFLGDNISSTTSPYSDSELDILYDRIGRIDNQDPLTIGVPRLNLPERKQILNDFLNFHCSYLNKLDRDRLVENETGKDAFKLNYEFDNGILAMWTLYKSEQILNKAEAFFNLNNIDIESATLWVDKKVTKMEYNLTKDKIPKKTKAWWKFW